MNEEIPPKIPHYEWYGSIREGETGKLARAGVGILIPDRGVSRIFFEVGRRHFFIILGEQVVDNKRVLWDEREFCGGGNGPLSPLNALLIPEGLGLVISTKKGRDFMAGMIKIGTSEWIFISIFVVHERGLQNGRLFEERIEYITHNYDEKNYLVIAGGMNAHIAQLAEQEDTRGWVLKKGLPDKRPTSEV